MPSLIDSLKLRYDTVFQSDTDSRFYQNLHHYYDLVEKTPELQSLLQSSQEEYAEKHSAIWGREKLKTEAEADDKSERTLRLERFNLYAASSAIYMRVYLPIEDYKHSSEPEEKQDPVALLMILGIKNIRTKRWSRETLKLYNRWFDGKRSYYEKELRQFHLLLVDAIEKMGKITPVRETPKPPEKKPPIDLNSRTGDFAFKNIAGNLTPNSQEYKVLRTLLESDDYLATYLQLIQAIRPNAEDSKSQRADLYKVILRLKDKMGMPERTPDIFQNVKGVGYRLVFPDSNQKAE